MHKAITHYPDRLVINFALRPRQPGDSPASEDGLEIAKSYMRSKGWLDENGKPLVEDIHSEMTPAEPDAATFTMGWHLPKPGPAGCRRCKKN